MTVPIALRSRRGAGLPEVDRPAIRRGGRGPFRGRRREDVDLRAAGLWVRGIGAAGVAAAATARLHQQLPALRGTGHVDGRPVDRRASGAPRRPYRRRDGPRSGAGSPPMFPFLFVTIACGAVSGFHSLVSSGTTVRQLNREGNALPIGYGAMLTEGALAVLVIMACVAGLGAAAWESRRDVFELGRRAGLGRQP